VNLQTVCDQIILKFSISKQFGQTVCKFTFLGGLVKLSLNFHFQTISKPSVNLLLQTFSSKPVANLHLQTVCPKSSTNITTVLKKTVVNYFFADSFQNTVFVKFFIPDPFMKSVSNNLILDSFETV
jgi:hypothetical protein